MTGWRIGFIAGNAKLVSAIATVKDNYDSGQFIPIQKAAAYALSQPEITKQTAEKYSRRHDLLSAILRECGFRCKKTKRILFLIYKDSKAVENGPEFHSAEDFSQYLINEHLISTVPWDDAGSYVRFSVTFQADGREEEQQIFDEIRARLCTSKFIF